MTSQGLCWKCGTATGRYDIDARRWACRACWPRRLPYEGQILDVLEAESAPPQIGSTPPQRLAGESRQAWRRRAREAQTR